MVERTSRHAVDLRFFFFVSSGNPDPRRSQRATYGQRTYGRKFTSASEHNPKSQRYHKHRAASRTSALWTILPTLTSVALVAADAEYIPGTCGRHELSLLLHTCRATTSNQPHESRLYLGEGGGGGSSSVSCCFISAKKLTDSRSTPSGSRPGTRWSKLSGTGYWITSG